MFRNRPPEVRKKIAFIITLCVAGALMVVMVLVYRSPSYRSAGEESSAIRDFYQAIQHRGESLFKEK